MRRRLSIAIALGSSRCVFLDEPTTGLDVISRRQVIFLFLVHGHHLYTHFPHTIVGLGRHFTCSRTR
jgi:ABC-type dipeptide/oligopeptide/nickel transport system ATPase component